MEEVGGTPSVPGVEGAATVRVSLWREEDCVFEPVLDAKGQHEIPVELYERYKRAMSEFNDVQKELGAMESARMAEEEFRAKLAQRGWDDSCT